MKKKRSERWLLVCGDSFVTGGIVEVLSSQGVYV